MNTTASKSLKIANRFTFIDGLRGLAALAVVGFHFYIGSPLKTPLSQILPLPIRLFFENGQLAVEVFFVISGFVIAYSLRNIVITPGISIKLNLVRLTRLHPPYLATIILTLLLNYISNLFLSDRQAPISGIHEILYHFFYIQDILGAKQISPVCWTLCIEVQFYIIFIILLGLQRLPMSKRRKQNYYVIFWVFAIVSIFLEINESFSLKEYFISYWYAFFLGVLVQWVSDKRCHTNHLLLLLMILTVVYIFNQNPAILTVLASGIVIALSVNYSKLGKLLDHLVFQYFGKISYSLYLIHPLIGARVINICYRFVDITPISAIGVFILAISLSIFSAHLMYFYIEKPAIKMSRQMKEFVFADPA